jgi:hypothetical protein
MNQWNQLQQVLDTMFGQGRKQTSRVAKRSQSFDNKTGESVVLIEYRFKDAMGVKNDGGFPVLAKYAQMLRQGR